MIISTSNENFIDEDLIYHWTDLVVYHLENYLASPHKPSIESAAFLAMQILINLRSVNN